MNWTHSCKKVAELLTLSLDEPLGWLDRIRLRVHLSMCSNCSNVQRQLVAVKALSSDLFAMDDGDVDGAGPAAAPGTPNAQER